MAENKQGKQGKQGLRGPAGPAGQIGGRGARGLRGLTGARGARGLRGALGPGDIDTKKLVKAVDGELEGIYRELSMQIRRMSTVQEHIEDLRIAIRRLGGTVRSDRR